MLPSSHALLGSVDGRFQTIALGKGGVEVVLKPVEQALADQLIATYGLAVDVTVRADVESCTLTLTLATM